MGPSLYRPHANSAPTHAAPSLCQLEYTSTSPPTRRRPFFSPPLASCFSSAAAAAPSPALLDAVTLRRSAVHKPDTTIATVAPFFSHSHSTARCPQHHREEARSRWPAAAHRRTWWVSTTASARRLARAASASSSRAPTCSTSSRSPSSSSRAKATRPSCATSTAPTRSWSVAVSLSLPFLRDAGVPLAARDVDRQCCFALANAYVRVTMLRRTGAIAIAAIIVARLLTT
jgi:hypothetical protein